MNILVLIPKVQKIEYALFGDADRNALLEKQISGLISDTEFLADSLRTIKADCIKLDIGSIDMVTIHSPYGGSIFTGTTLVSAEMLTNFAKLAAEAPMHVPIVHKLALAVMSKFPDSTVSMSFDTAFFADLPDREKRYGISDDHIRRFGYHGLYHQAADNECSGQGKSAATRILSVCLQPRPEVTAIINHRPVFVTSGATPLEGLPGETKCGELDPTIVLALARGKKWGPEQINEVLTCKSGLLGLMGRHVSVGETLAAIKSENGQISEVTENKLENACNILIYRILLAGGAGMATMGGLDKIVLSGQYAESGRKMGYWLAKRLTPSFDDSLQPPPVSICTTSLSRLLADHAFCISKDTEKTL